MYLSPACVHAAGAGPHRALDFPQPTTGHLRISDPRLRALYTRPVTERQCLFL